MASRVTCRCIAARDFLFIFSISLVWLVFKFESWFLTWFCAVGIWNKIPSPELPHFGFSWGCFIFSSICYIWEFHGWKEETDTDFYVHSIRRESFGKLECCQLKSFIFFYWLFSVCVMDLNFSLIWVVKTLVIMHQMLCVFSLSMCAWLLMEDERILFIVPAVDFLSHAMRWLWDVDAVCMNLLWWSSASVVQQSFELTLIILSDNHTVVSEFMLGSDM